MAEHLKLGRRLPEPAHEHEPRAIERITLDHDLVELGAARWTKAQVAEDQVVVRIPSDPLEGRPDPVRIVDVRGAKERASHGFGDERVVIDEENPQTVHRDHSIMRLTDSQSILQSAQLAA